MNFPETIVQPRVSTTTREELDAETYDEDFERMKGHVYSESAYRERNDGGMGDHFISKKRVLEQVCLVILYCYMMFVKNNRILKREEFQDRRKE